MICSKCKTDKPTDQFNKSHWCKSCVHEYNKTYKKQHKAEISDSNKDYFKHYYHAHAEKIKEQVKGYASENENEIKKRTAIYRKEHKKEKAEYGKKYRAKKKSLIKGRHRQYMARKLKQDPDFRLLANLRLRIWHAVRNKSDRTLNLIGCSIEELKAHLQQTALNNGYVDFDINNYSGKKYHIDHIVPCSSFKINCSFHQKLCFHYSNLQILTREENLIKANNLSIF